VEKALPDFRQGFFALWTDVSCCARLHGVILRRPLSAGRSSRLVTKSRLGSHNEAARFPGIGLPGRTDFPANPSKGGDAKPRG
jgi:hypothetical protein